MAATGYALAQTLERESPDLVLLGQQSDDGECYTIGAVLADHLRMPSLTQVIKMDVVEGKLTCERQAEYGSDTVEIRTPAVIFVGDAINEPRYPSLGAMESGLFHLEKASRSAHPEAAPRAVYWLGVALAKKGNVSLARAALQQAAATGPPELRDAALEELSALGSV